MKREKNGVCARNRKCDWSEHSTKSVFVEKMKKTKSKRSIFISFQIDRYKNIVLNHESNPNTKSRKKWWYKWLQSLPFSFFKLKRTDDVERNRQIWRFKSFLVYQHRERKNKLTVGFFHFSIWYDMIWHLSLQRKYADLNTRNCEKLIWRQKQKQMKYGRYCIQHFHIKPNKHTAIRIKTLANL